MEIFRARKYLFRQGGKYGECGDEFEFDYE